MTKEEFECRVRADIAYCRQMLPDYDLSVKFDYVDGASVTILSGKELVSFNGYHGSGNATWEIFTNRFFGELMYRAICGRVKKSKNSEG